MRDAVEGELLGDGFLDYVAVVHVRGVAVGMKCNIDKEGGFR